MKQLNLLKTLFLLCALVVGSLNSWADEEVTIWSENFSAYSADDVPSGTITLPHTGTTLNATGTLTYSCTDGNGTKPGTTKIWEDALAGGTSPELLVGKYGSGGDTGGKFTAVIPLDNIEGTLTLKFNINKQKLHIYSTTVGVSGEYDKKPDAAGQQTTTFTGITSDMTSLTLVFQAYSSNVRLDNIELTGNQVAATKAATPTFDPAAGVVVSGTEVTISCGTDGATIYYTTNGDTPTTSSTVYNPASKPTITAATTIKAYAVKAGLTDSDVASASYTVAEPCATPTFSVAEGEVDKGTSVTISCGTAGATIYYTTDGTTPTTSSTEYSSALTINTNQTIKAIAAKDGYANSAIASVTYTVRDYASLPFEWAGGTKEELAAVLGVTTDGLGTNYAPGNAPYRVKMDGVGDYIQVKTNAQPDKVYVGIKMIGGATTSKIKVQESADGKTFTDVEELTISGNQNDVLNLETSNAFDADSRYVRIIKSVHGSNIGVGPISIVKTTPVTITSAKYATYVNESEVLDFSATGITAYTATAGATSVTLNEITSGKVPANTPVVLFKDDADGTAIDVPIIASADPVGDNDLVKSIGGTPSNAYVLAKKSGVVGFYKWAGGSITSGKVYLQASTSAPEFLGFGDDTTGINEVAADKTFNGEFFNLAGQRVAQPQKGLYIVNGKKVIIK